MTFYCFTDHEPCIGVPAPPCVGSPLTAAAWYLELLSSERRENLVYIGVYWGAEYQFYKIEEDKLVAYA